VDPDVRTALLVIGLLFVFAFAGMTLYVIGDSGFNTVGDLLLAVTSLGVVVFISLGLIGAIRNPPK
jgi:hypothetical protein